MPVPLTQRIDAERRRGFVGRRRELALFRSLLRRPESAAVVLVHGPGGVGKTTLLRQGAWLGRRAGRQVLWLDGRDVAPTPAAVLAGLASAAGHDAAADPRDALAATSRPLMLVDSAERLAPLEGWLRDDLLPRLPADAVVVLAGRDLPSLDWRADPGWRSVLRTVRLGNFGPDESVELLRRRGVPEHDHAGALAFTHGHPLALALVADLSAQPGAERLSIETTPEVVTALLGRLVDAVPGPLHRAALEASAHVRVTTEPLLAALLDLADARALFDWLRGLSMMEYGAVGVFPHDLARDALAAEMRWRHPERFAEIHRRAGACYQQQFQRADPAAQQAVLLDFVFLHRYSPVLAPFLAMTAPGATEVEGLCAAPLAAGEPDALLAMVAAHEGEESARLAGHWFARQPGSVFAVRAGDGRPVGCFVVLEIQEATDADRAIDPAVAQACSYLARRAPLRAGEVAAMVRFWMAADGYQAVSPVQTLITLQLVRYYLTTPALAFSFLPCADPGFWADAFAYADLARLPEADFEVGGRRYGMYGHDWRTVPPLAWLALLAERETAAAPLDVPSPAVAEPLRLLDHPEFARAVRAALRDLGRADRLRDSPLLQSRLVGRVAGAGAGPVERVEGLRRAIAEAAAALEASPRDRRAFRALHHTYLQPAATQERAAELLSLPMSTFRRHLAAGVEQLTALLWRHEVDEP